EWELLRSDTKNLLIIRNRKKQRLPLSEKDSLRAIAIVRSCDEKLNDELLALYEKTLVYEVDTIQISKENKFLGIADNFFNNRENRTILDRTIERITVANAKDEPYVFYAHSPSKESHPEIYELISALRNTYTTHQN